MGLSWDLLFLFFLMASLASSYWDFHGISMEIILNIYRFSGCFLTCKNQQIDQPLRYNQETYYRHVNTGYII